MIGGAIGQLIPVWIVKDGSHFHQSQITTLMIVEASYASFMLVLVLHFFRNKPHKPPSPTASQQREPFCKSMKLLLSNWNFILLVLTFFCIVGTLNNLATILEEIFSLYSYPNPTTFSSLVNSLNFFVGFGGSIVFAAIADRTKKFKLLMFVCAFESACVLACFTWLAPRRSAWLSGSLVCLFGAFNVATIPLALELGAELSYPVGEAYSSGLVMSASQVSAVVLSYISSALFDASSDSSTRSPYIVNLMNFGVCCLGSFLVLGIKGKLG